VRSLACSRIRGGSLQPFDAFPSGRPWGARATLGGGESLTTLPCGVACEARGGPSLREARPTKTHRHRFNPSSAQPVTGSRGRPQAALRNAVTFGGPTSRELVSARGERRRGSRGSLPAHFEGGELSHDVLAREGEHVKRGQTRRAQGSERAVSSAGEDRTLEGRARALFVCCRSR
jgi:hypothetical protein